MPIFCYVHRREADTPYLEVLSQAGPPAIARARKLLAERPGAVRAELWDDGRLLHTVVRDPG